MAQVRQLLRDLNLGNSVAEFDAQLEKYFVETQTFRELVEDNKDIVAGDKGTGKTAIFRILHRRYTSIPALRHVVVIQAFNPTGNPIFQELTEKGTLDEGEYGRVWKAFILSLVGNWLLKHNKFGRKSNLATLDQLLRGLDLRSDSDEPKTVFQKILSKIGALFHWKSAELKVETTAEGAISITPKIEFDKSKNAETVKISIEAALRLLNNCLVELGKKVWVAVDRLDEAFQGNPEVEIPALRALFRSYLDLLEFDKIALKLFVRRDLFSRIVEGGFVNLTHVNARKIEIIWDEEDLRSLLCRRVRQNNTFMAALNEAHGSDEQLFKVLFPEQVDQGKRKPPTWVWMMGRIRDANDIKPPRNLIDLVSMAKDAQARREDREPREYEPGKPLVEADSLRKALTQLSEQRVTDTLLAEARQNVPLIEKFRQGKAEHNEASLAVLLSIPQEKVRSVIKPLTELGFLEEIGGNFKVPMLYRGGLEITQGKAFEASASDDDDDEA